MDDELIDDTGRPLSRYTRLPGAGFFYPDSLDEQRAETRDRETIEGADAVVIADGDADGLACAAMIRRESGWRRRGRRRNRTRRGERGRR